MAEMKAGYKQTDIGIIPEDWDVMSVFDFGSFKSGNGFPLSYQGHQNGDLPFFKVSDMNNVGNGTYMKNANNYVSDEVSRTLKLNIIPKKSIVFAKIGAAIFLERKKLTVRRSCIDNNMMAYLLNHEIGEIEYFRYLFLNTEFGKLVSATALPSLSPKDIGELRYGFPKKKEQQRIAAALSDVDGLIESLSQLIAKKRDMKTAAMQQLLTGKKRLPGFSSEWAEKRIDEFGYFKSGNGFPTKYQGHQKGKYGFFKVSDMNNIGNSTHMHLANNYISNSVAKILGANIIPERSIVFAKIGAAIFLERKKVTVSECCIDNNMMAFILDHKISDYIFFHYLFLHLEFGKLVTATALPSLSPKDIGSLSLFLPKKEEQKAIAAILSDMDTEIDTLEKRLDKARSLKTGMMQELLTGRTRLIKTDKEQEAV